MSWHIAETRDQARAEAKEGLFRHNNEYTTGALNPVDGEIFKTYVYGPFPTGMGSFDENVPLDDYLHLVKTHALSAYDYLSKS